MIGSRPQSTALQRNGKDPIVAGRVGELEGSETPTPLFHFPRAGDLISQPYKDVTFSARIRAAHLKVNCVLEDFQNHGQVSL